MKNADDPNLPLNIYNLTSERNARLRELFPEVFVGEHLDWQRLKQALGEKESYGLSWCGKQEAIQASKTPSTATLVPVPGESLQFDLAENVLIEGDNLEVLKLLKEGYRSRIKMIYIDPPYNSGHVFSFPDYRHYHEGLEGYLDYVNQMQEGNRASASEADAEATDSHSTWLRMMYPRLVQARELLREDGVIFVTIDDQELATLRLLMDEVFGEQNFIATIVWQKIFSPKSIVRLFGEDHDYIVMYARNAQHWVPCPMPRTEDLEERYSNPDNDPRGPWTPSDLWSRAYAKEGSYLVIPPTGSPHGPPYGTYWRIAKERWLQLQADDRIYWENAEDQQPRLKRFLSDVKAGCVPRALWKYEEVGHTREGQEALLARVPYRTPDRAFATPKPPRLVERMLQIATSPDEGDIILDFFAGSGTTGEAVVNANRRDGGNRRYLLVQLPEPTGVEEYPTVCDIIKTRLRSVASEHHERTTDACTECGFRFFRLAASRLLLGKTNPNSTQSLRGVMLPTPVKLLYELILKAGLPLTVRIEPIHIAKQIVYSVANGRMLVCLEDELNPPLLENLIRLKPQLVICFRHALYPDDPCGEAIAARMQSRGIEFQTL